MDTLRVTICYRCRAAIRKARSRDFGLGGMEDKLALKEMLINKVLMENQACGADIKQAGTQLRKKMKTGGELQCIDFHQLQIEGQQFAIRIGVTTQELIDLERRSGMTVKSWNKACPCRGLGARATGDISMRVIRMSAIICV